MQNRTRPNAMLSPILSRNRKCERSAVQTICMKKRKYNNRRETVGAYCVLCVCTHLGVPADYCTRHAGQLVKSRANRPTGSLNFAYVSLVHFIYIFNFKSFLSQDKNALFVTDLLAAHKKLRVFFSMNRRSKRTYIFIYSVFVCSITVTVPL